MQFVKTAVHEECSGFTVQTKQVDFQAELHNRIILRRCNTVKHETSS